MKKVLSCIQFHQACLTSFYKTYPLFKLALFLSFGIGTYFFPLTLTLLPLFIPRSRPLAPLTLCIIGFFHAFINTSHIDLKVPMKGSALLQVDQRFKQNNPIFTKTFFKGRLKAFRSEEDKTLGNIPVFFPSPKGSALIKEGGTYFIKSATIEPTDKGNCYLKLNSKNPPLLIKKGRSLSSLKNQCRLIAKKRIEKAIKSKPVKHMVLALFLGIPPPALVKYFFQTTGLSHLLSISGFHLILCFSILYTAFSFFIRREKASLLALLLLTFYVVCLLPSSSSINRAFLGISFYCLGLLKNSEPSPLNLLGGACLISLIIDPNQLLNISFQLSYSATFALLWILPFIKKNLSSLFPERSLHSVLSMPLTSKLGSIAITHIKTILSLNIAIELVTLPLIIYHFESLSAITFLYNLFCPLLFGSLILLAYLSFALSTLLPFLEPMLMTFLEKSFSSFFDLLLHFPKKLATPLFIHLSSPLIPLWSLAILFLIVLHSTYKRQPHTLNRLTV